MKRSTCLQRTDARSHIVGVVGALAAAVVLLSPTLVSAQAARTVASDASTTWRQERVEPLAEADARQLEAALLEGRDAPEEPEPEPGRAF